MCPAPRAAAPSRASHQLQVATSDVCLVELLQQRARHLGPGPAHRVQCHEKVAPNVFGADLVRVHNRKRADTWDGPTVTHAKERKPPRSRDRSACAGVTNTRMASSAVRPGRTRFLSVSVPTAVALSKPMWLFSSSSWPCSPHSLSNSAGRRVLSAAMLSVRALPRARKYCPSHDHRHHTFTHTHHLRTHIICAAQVCHLHVSVTCTCLSPARVCHLRASAACTHLSPSRYTSVTCALTYSTHLSDVLTRAPLLREFAVSSPLSQ